MDAKELEDVDKVEYYYTQVVHTVYEWIEFIEHWILKVDVLPVDQNTEQCKVSLLSSVFNYLFLIISCMATSYELVLENNYQLTVDRLFSFLYYI